MHIHVLSLHGIIFVDVDDSATDQKDAIISGLAGALAFVCMIVVILVVGNFYLR